MGNRQSQKILTKIKSLGPENIFSSPSVIKAQKLTAVCLFKIESVLSKSLKIVKKRSISKICAEIFSF